MSIKRLEVGNIYKTKNGITVLIEREESELSPVQWDFVGRDTLFKRYFHFNTRGQCIQGEQYNLEKHASGSY